MPGYNPLDWYWIVGGSGPHVDETGAFTGDESRVFSSARNQYVPADDPTYVAWRDAEIAAGGYDPTTRIDTEENLAAALAPTGFVPTFG